MHLRTVGPVAFGATLCASLAAYPRMPPRVPIHWDLLGNADGFAPRVVGAAVGPALVLGVTLLFAALARVDPLARREGAAQARGREALVGWSIALIAALAVVFTAASAGAVRSVPRAVALALAGFLLVGGNAFGRVRPNWFAGIRTRWTLSSDQVWRQTHRLAARMMVVSGLALVLLALVLPAPLAHAAAIALLLVSTGVPAVWSYVLHRRETDAAAQR